MFTDRIIVMENANDELGDLISELDGFNWAENQMRHVQIRARASTIIRESNLAQKEQEKSERPKGGE